MGWDKRAFNSRSQPTKVQIIFYIWNPWNLCVTLKEEIIYVLFLEVPAGDEPGQWLMLPLPLPVRLPPVGIVRADHMENVALHEGDAQLSTGNVYVLLWIVVKQGFYMNLGTKENKTLSKYKSCCVDRNQILGMVTISDYRRFCLEPNFVVYCTGCIFFLTTGTHQLLLLAGWWFRGEATSGNDHECYCSTHVGLETNKELIICV